MPTTEQTENHPPGPATRDTWGRLLIVIGLSLAIGGVGWYAAAVATVGDLAPSAAVATDSRLSLVARNQADTVMHLGTLAAMVGIIVGTAAAVAGLRMAGRRRLPVGDGQQVDALELAYGEGPRWRM